MKRLYKLIAVLFLCFYTGIAQESSKKHTVSIGETLLSISKKYNVTPYDLQKANPGAIANIKVNDILIIPQSKIKHPILESKADSIKSSVVSSSISHTVKTGETKFSLAKRFGMTTTQLQSQNPQIISGLHVGQVLEIFPSLTQSDTEVAPKQPNQNSKEGKTHRVLKGETLFRISSANGLTVDELVKANSNTISGSLKEGQILWIPVNNGHNASENSEGYIVKYGDTKFSLSRRFNTTVRELERKNPHIVKMLIVGQTIKMPSDDTHDSNTQVPQPEKNDTQAVAPVDEVQVVEKIVVILKVPSEVPAPKVEKEETVVDTEVPSKKIIVKTKAPSKKKGNDEKKLAVVENPVEKITPKQEELVATTAQLEEAIEEPNKVDATDNVDINYTAYKIQPNETVYALAEKAGMSIPEFLELNPQLKESVQIGTFIKMPKDGAISNTISNTEAPLVFAKSSSNYMDLRTSANTSQSKKLLFFLPFTKMDYKNYSINGDNFKNVADDFKRNHLEFYKGANIAIDSLRKMRLNLDIDIVEAQSTNQTSKIKSLIEDNTIKSYDAIILPFYKSIEEEIAAFTADHKIPVITASNIANQSNTNNLYSALPSIEHQRLKVLNHMMAKQAHIIVLSDVNRIKTKLLIANHVPKVDFIDLKQNGSFSESELKSKFKKNQLNYVVIDSERNSVFLNTTTVLLSELSNYKIQLAVLEASLIPDDSDVSQKRYQILKMIFPSLIPAKSTSSSKQFLSDYQKKYNALPSANVMLGFDITFDSLLRLIQQESFENSAIHNITEYTQLKFNYKKNTLGGYSNEGIYILQYDSDANIRDAN